MAGVQKNFTLPAELAKVWDRFLGTGSKESSKNAAGALLLFMALPEMQKIARDTAYTSSLSQKAMDNLRGIIVEQLLDAEVIAILRAMSHAERLQVLEDARKHIQKTSPKKKAPKGSK